jgi:glycosyltransferase involved in cell wall biosynthesis
MKISACIITKNEEKNIGTCLESMKNIVDEIILVDTGSVDQTLEIAKSYGVKIFSYNWRNDFAAAKNYAISKASGDWIIFLDADEYFPVDSVEMVKAYIKNMDRNKKCHAICVKINNIDTDRNNISISSFTTVRIFRNLPNLRYKESIHEELYNTQGQINFFMRENEIEVYHTGYSTNIVKKKLQRNLDIILHDMDKEGDQTKYYRYLCDCYHGLGEYEKAVYYGRMHIAAGGTSLGAESIVHGKIIESLIHNDAPIEEVKTEIQKAIDRFPASPDFYDRYARYAWQKQEYDLALKYFLRALELYENIKNKSYEADSFAGRIVYTYFLIGEIYFLQNKNQEAISYYLEALLVDKYNVAAFSRLYSLIMNIDAIEIIGILNQIYKRNKQDITFIVENISQFHLNKIFIYYSNILNKELSVNIEKLQIKQMLALKNYQKLYNNSIEIVKIKARLFAAMSIAQNDCSIIMEQKNVLPICYENIVLCFYQQERVLDTIDVKAYIELLCNLLTLQTNSLMHYINIAKSFSLEDSLRVIKVLEDYAKYCYAIDLYMDLMQRYDDKKSCCYAGLGYSYYKLEQYPNAIIWFSKELQENPKNQQVLHLQKWSERFLLKNDAQ